MILNVYLKLTKLIVTLMYPISQQFCNTYGYFILSFGTSDIHNHVDVYASNAAVYLVFPLPKVDHHFLCKELKYTIINIAPNDNK